MRQGKLQGEQLKGVPQKNWYFCVAPHRFCVKFHTHTAKICRNHILIIEDQGGSKPTTNAVEDPPDFYSIQADTDISIISDATHSSDITSLLT